MSGHLHGRAAADAAGVPPLLPGAAITIEAAMHFTVHKGFAILDRVLDQHVCNLILTKAATVEAAGRRRTLAAGGALWIGPGVRHSITLADASHPFSMLNLRFRIHRGRLPVELPERTLLVEDAWDLRPLWEMAIDDHLRRRPDQAERFGHLLALLHGDLAVRDHQDEAGGLSRRRRLQLAAWVSAHLHQRPTPGDLAAVVGLSTGWFRRAFCRSFGCSPRTWLTRERVRRAAQRLAEDPDLKVADLARELGYEDHRLLDRQFREAMGVSPGRWRRG